MFAKPIILVLGYIFEIRIESKEFWKKKMQCNVNDLEAMGYNT